MNTLIIFGAKYLVYLLILIAIFYIFNQDRKKQREIVILALIVLPLSYVIAKLASLLYYDPRPFVTGPPAGGFVPLVAHVADNGFPSDHTLLASAVAVVIFSFNKKIGIALFVLALIVGISRVLAGVHHTIDILGSMAIAVVVFYAVNLLIIPKIKNSKHFRF